MKHGLSLLLCLAAFSGISDAHAGEAFEVLAEPECILDMSRVQPQFPELVPGQTFLQVRHHGDPNTPEWVGQVANTVTWDVSFYSGFRPAMPISNWQRGYYDLGPPNGSSAVQLRCTQFGFMLNTYAFQHTQSVIGGGPNIAYERRFDPSPQAWPTEDSRLRLAVDFRLPWLYDVDSNFAIGRGVAQVSLVYYLVHLETGRIFAHVIGLFDNRPFGVGTGNEFLSNDTFFDFASTPLVDVLANGLAPRFARPSPTSARMRNDQPFAETLSFAADIDVSAMRDLIAALNLRDISGQPAQPSQFGLRNAAVLIEAFPGDNNDYNLSFSGSFDGFTVTRFGSSLASAEVFNSGFEAGEAKPSVALAIDTRVRSPSEFGNSFSRQRGGHHTKSGHIQTRRPAH